MGAWTPREGFARAPANGVTWALVDDSGDFSKFVVLEGGRPLKLRPGIRFSNGDPLTGRPTGPEGGSSRGEGAGTQSPGRRQGPGQATAEGAGHVRG